MTKQQEPVAWYVERIPPGKQASGVQRGLFLTLEQAEIWVDDVSDLIPLYAHSAKRELATLTEDEIYAVIRPLCNDDTAAKMLVESSMDEYRAIEAKLREKNRA